jgi:hypothetical protein
MNEHVLNGQFEQTFQMPEFVVHVYVWGYDAPP